MEKYRKVEKKKSLVEVWRINKMFLRVKFDYGWRYIRHDERSCQFIYRSKDIDLIN